MWRAAFIALLVGSTTATNLDYLDPVKLQTITSAEIQQKAAKEIISRYSKITIDYEEIDLVNIVVDPTLFKDNKDVFHLNTFDEKLHIEASSGVAAVWGFNYYLKKYCKSQIEWQTKNVHIPSPLPPVKETVIANDRFRYYQNVCTASYSFVWWNIYDWREHLGWMALNGINLVLAPVAQEAIWSRVYKRFGMTQEEIDDHFTGPAFLSWLRMGNVHGFGGPLPKSWHELQTTIQDEITDNMLRLGMVPVLPAFNGHIPKAFSLLYPNSTFHSVGQWNNFDEHYCCGLFLDPNDPLFRTIGKMFLEEMNGIPNAHIYTADPFNEVKLEHFSTALAQDVSRQIYATLSDFDQDAVWLLQNWMFVSDPLLWPKNRVKAFITSVPNGRMLILDLQAEQWPQYDLYEMYFGQSFIWCMLHNFGGTLGMFGNMVTINKDVYEVRSRSNTTMIGVGLTPEGINQNYVVYDLMLESAWRKEPVKDLNAWVADYAERRYGCRTTAEAWRYLLKSVYSFNGLNRVRGKYVITRRPSFRIKPWAWYRSYDLLAALKNLVFINNTECVSEGYFYDVVDVTRQVLQYRAEQIYVNIVNDRYTNLFVFQASVDQFIDVLQDMQSILYVSEYFLSSKWFDKAENIGKDDIEKYFYKLNARNQVSLWGPNGEISDYACKQWSEMFSEYYIPRWRMFLSAALKAKETNQVFDEKATRRVVTANVEVPFLNIANRLLHLNILRTNTDILQKSKELYKKWVYLPGVEDLPVVIIKPDPERRTTMADVEFDYETPELPSVVTSPTPLGH